MAARMVITFFLLLLLGTAGPGEASAVPVLEDYIYTEGFESGSVGSWSSYPPAQDTAYDPSIWVRPLYADRKAGNRALYREIRPNYKIDYVFGVRKKFDMYVDDSSVLTFRCLVKSYTGTKGVRLRFGFADETSCELLIPFAETEVWHGCTVRFSDLATGGMKKLTGIAFMAVCPGADPETMLRFGLDEVRITGFREKQWNFTGPAVHKLDEWRDFIAGGHFREGGTLTISGSPPVPVRGVTVRVSRALTGGDERTFRMKRSRDGAWRVVIPLDGRKGPGPGFWRATITSGNKSGETFSTSLVFLVKRKDAPEGHPRLFMSAGERERILERASSGRLKEVLERIREQARRRREERDPAEFGYNLDAYDEIYWLPTFGGYISEIRTAEHMIRDNAVVYGVTRDREAGDAARKTLLKLAEWPTYVHPHIINQGQFSYWPEGIMLTNLALGYDMVYDLFTARERRKVAEALYEKGLLQVFNEYVRDDRVSSSTSNWIADVMGAGILISVALMDEYGDDELEPYLGGCILKLGELVENAFDPDGGYGEGVLYYSHALHCLTKAMAVLERTFGVRFPEKIARSHLSLLYRTDPVTKDVFDFGDAYRNLTMFRWDSYLSLSNFSYLIGKYRDPRLRWLYEASPGANELDLFFLDETVPAEGPDGLPTVKLFGEIGTAVFRSGFGHGDFVFIFRCGPFYNHQHLDQGGFHLVDRGEKFLGEVGRSDYYNDPWYQKLIIQPGGHNCILVDGNPESQRPGDFLKDVPAWKDYARITDFLRFDGGACVSGRLEPLYKGKLSKLRRTALYVEPRTVVLIDEAVGAGDAREINLRFHAPDRESISVRGRDTLITRPAGTLTIHTVSPGSYRAEILKRPMTLVEFDREDAVRMKARGFLQLTADLGWAGTSTTFVNVLSTEDGVNARLNERVHGDHVVLNLGGSDYFINKTDGKRYSDGELSTDALVFSERDGGFVAVRATHVAENGKILLESDEPVTLEFGGGGKDGSTVTYSLSLRSDMRLRLSSRPRRITLNGAKFTGWKYNAETGLRLTLPAGNGVLEIR